MKGLHGEQGFIHFAREEEGRGSLYFNTFHIAGDAADLHDELAMRHPEPFQGCNDEFRYDAALLDRVEINIAGYG